MFQIRSQLIISLLRQSVSSYWRVHVQNGKSSESGASEAKMLSIFYSFGDTDWTLSPGNGAEKQTEWMLLTGGNKN